MRNYEKSSPEKSPIDRKTKSDVKMADTSFVIQPIKDAGLKYRKDAGEIIPKSFFIIISGGEKTERLYFKIISNQDKFNRIKIEFVADPNKLNPIGLLETAKYKQEHYQTSQEDEPDKIYIVSDVDHFMNELLSIKQESEKLNISLIISNSCFEVWLYYAYHDKIKGFVASNDKLKISRDFRKWMPNTINPTKAIFNICQNIANAKSNYAEEENGIPKLLSTNMFILVESLLPYINVELEKLITGNEQRKNAYKK